MPAEQPLFQGKPALLEDFKNYIDQSLGEHHHTGTNGDGEEVPFVCKHALEEYWRPGVINSILRDSNNSQANAATIFSKHLILFSILCYVSRPQYFNLFTDHNIDDEILTRNATFPLLDQSWWVEDVHFPQAFLDASWMFKPLRFDKTVIHRKQIPNNLILPIINADKIVLGTPKDESIVFRVSLHPCCVGPDFDKILMSHQAASCTPSTRQVVLKMFLADSETSEAKRLWDTEVEAYNALHNNSGGRLGSIVPTSTTMPRDIPLAPVFNYITRYLGSFRRIPLPNCSLADREIDRTKVNGTHFVVVEYAPGGDLSEFCRDPKYHTIITSNDRADRLNLWHHLFELLKAFSAIHNSGHGGTYQDIKDRNIVYTGGDLSGRVKACFKLTDFDRTHFNQISRSETANGFKWGNRTFMAPECSGVDDIEQAIPRAYTKAADIWGLGCLYSEMLIRSTLGPEGLERYRQARISENRGTSIGEIAQQCFHNRSNRLSWVDLFHQEAVDANPDDEVTAFVSELILKFMLQPKRHREEDALTIRAEWHRRFENEYRRQPAGELLPPQRPAFAMAPSIPRSEPTPASPSPQGPELVQSPAVNTVRSVRDIILHLQNDKWIRRSRIDENTFPLLAQRLNMLGYRQHFLLVDDSAAMLIHRDAVADTVRVLTKAVKHSSKELKPEKDIKLYFLSKPNEAVVRAKSTRLAQQVREHDFRCTESFDTLLGAWFSTFAHGIIQALVLSPRISLYILSNGVYDAPLSLASLCKEILSSLKKAGRMMPDFLSITIIRFGDNPAGYNELLRIHRDMEVVTTRDLKASRNPIFICHADDDVSDLITGGIRARALPPSAGGAVSQQTRTKYQDA
ncbi:hypothetical protein QBC43DRAFT_324995 [Cladorrhinum sp. PSN259]|nr:hypothetical protein QBC43DRAFT_324995 [Cladorrhinum sp. PSN259]